MTHYLLAVALLLTPPADPVNPAAFRLAREMQGVAIDWQILDAREARYVLTRESDLQGDMMLLRRRRLELADAPLVEDADRFPARTTVNDCLAFNRAYRQHIDVRRPGEPARSWQWRGALMEADWLYAVWDKVRDTRCEYYYVTVRRHALLDLREMIGPEAYYLGRLPPYIPLWRFEPIH